ncbi:MAG TPA: ABC transporter permease [Acidimicrobiales bacterium]|nr:ABC transporter permease [Acidimicrobiales bacterium]
MSLNFLLPRAMPGDPIDAQLSVGSPTYVYDERARADLAAYYGLDRPMGAQYVDYMANLAQGDLGRSVSTHTPVSKLIKDRLPWTLLLSTTGVAVATVVGFVAGVNAGWRPERRSDRGLITAFVALQNVPSFVLAAMTLLLFSVQLAWFPLSGARTPFSSFGALASVADVARHLTLPALVLATEVAALQFLLARGSVVSELGADYLVLGRVKGLTERRLKYRYAARNAMIPVVSNTAVQLGLAVTGAVFVERVFAYPGVGRLLFESIGSRDYPAIQGCFLVITVLVLTLNFLADILYRRLDPRTAQ